jgi:hypothetical protein
MIVEDGERRDEEQVVRMDKIETLVSSFLLSDEYITKHSIFGLSRPYTGIRLSVAC